MKGAIIVALILYIFFKPFDVENSPEDGMKHQFWQSMDLWEPWGRV